jgi:hypothetical protein
VTRHNAAPNPAFAEHVTGQCFVLTLGKTHVAALLNFHEGHQNRDRMARCSLLNRGLITEHNLKNDHPWWPTVKLTRAGALVVELLIEAGIARK